MHRLPAPKGDATTPLKALLVDSWYDAYLGVVVLVRIIDGTLSKGQRIRLMSTGGAYQIDRVGIFRPKQEMRECAWARRDRLLHRLDQAGRRYPRRRHRDRREAAGGGTRCRASSRRSPWCSAACSRSMRASSRICARRSASSASTMRASPTRWRPRPRSASASAAAFSACCISRSSASGSSANSTST